MRQAEIRASPESCTSTFSSKASKIAPIFSAAEIISYGLDISLRELPIVPSHHLCNPVSVGSWCHSWPIHQAASHRLFKGLVKELGERSCFIHLVLADNVLMVATAKMLMIVEPCV